MGLRLFLRHARVLLRVSDTDMPAAFKEAKSWLIPVGFFVFGTSGLFWLYQKRQPFSQSALTMLSTDQMDGLPVGLQTEDSLFSRTFGENQPSIRLQSVRWDGMDALSKAQGEVLELWKALQKEHLPIIDHPRVTCINDDLSIRFSLSEKTNVLHCILNMVDALSKHSHLNVAVKNTGFHLKMNKENILATLQFECAGPTTNMSIRITAPIVSEGAPEVEVLKKRALNEGDLMILELILRSAAKAQGEKWQQIQSLENWLQSKPEDDLFLELENKMQEFMRDFPFVPSMEPYKGWPSFPDMRQSEGSVSSHQENVGGDHVSPDGIAKKLEGMGAIVYRPNPTEKLDWGVLSGYADQKRRIEDGLLLPLLHPDVSESIAQRTRKHYASNRPRGVLFEGKPGTGKTSSARIIASQASVHMIYLPLESILSKWYGESEKLLSDAFKAAEQLGGAIVFFDEIETLGTKRTDDMHEASRRLLSVLLREMDGFDTNKRIIVIGATNRKQDIDPALLSRFDSIIKFDLPDEDCRSLIFNQYAQQLNQTEIDALAGMGEGMSGRDIRDVCESTERMWASRIVRGEVEKGQLPRFQDYMDAVSQRQDTNEQI